MTCLKHSLLFSILAILFCSCNGLRCTKSYQYKIEGEQARFNYQKACGSKYASDIGFTTVLYFYLPVIDTLRRWQKIDPVSQGYSSYSVWDFDADSTIVCGRVKVLRQYSASKGLLLRCDLEVVDQASGSRIRRFRRKVKFWEEEFPNEM